MMVGDEQLVKWLRKGAKNGATHLIIMRDMVTLAYAPWFVMPHEQPHNVCEDINESMIYSVVDVWHIDIKYGTKHP